MTDAAMAKVLRRSVHYVVSTRLKLGLKRPRGRPAGRDIKISHQELLKALTLDGRTQAEVAAELGVSKQAVNQWCAAYGIKVWRDRQPIWFARRLGLPILAQKKRLNRALRAAGSVNALAARLGIDFETLSAHLRRLKIKAPPRHRRVYIKVKCEVCGRKVKRDVKQINPGQKVFFCKRQCHGYYMGTKNGRKSHAES